jgi:hypothetical protein
LKWSGCREVLGDRKIKGRQGVGDSKDLIPTMRAAYREGIGCVAMGIDQTFADIDKLPKLEMALK